MDPVGVWGASDCCLTVEWNSCGVSKLSMREAENLRLNLTIEQTVTNLPFPPSCRMMLIPVSLVRATIQHLNPKPQTLTSYNTRAPNTRGLCS